MNQERRKIVPNHNSFADQISDWERLLAACDANAALLPGLEPFRNMLVQVIAEAKTLKAAQEIMGRKRQVITKHLADSCETGRESARRLRSFVKFRLGTKSEQLPQFGIAPIHPRRKPAKK
jgi:hypothetical protein